MRQAPVQNPSRTKRIEETGSRVALMAALGEIQEEVEKITKIMADSGSRMDEVKLCLNVLESAESLRFSAEWIYDKLEKLIQFLSNAQMQAELSKLVDIDFLLQAIKRAVVCFYPFVANPRSLGKIGVARLDEKKTFVLQGQNAQDKEDFYETLNKYLEKTEGRKNYYDDKAPRNPAKKAALRLLDYVVKFRFPQAFVWVALQLLLTVSEKRSEARDIFCAFYNSEFPRYLDEIPPGIPRQFKPDADEIKNISEAEIDKILHRADTLAKGTENLAEFRLRFKTLWQIVQYDDKLRLESSSFCHYRKLGVKKGQTTNRGKRSAARDLFYSVVTGGSSYEILMAMSRFVLHTKANSKGEKLFTPFYLESCSGYFPQYLQLESYKGKSILRMLSKPGSLQDDVLAYWVLYAALHSLVLAEPDIFKKELLEGGAETLKDLAAGIDPKKPLKSALIKLKGTLDQGSEFSQLLAVTRQVANAFINSDKNDTYYEIGQQVQGINNTFHINRPPEKEDVEEFACARDFTELYAKDMSVEIQKVVGDSEKLRLQMANLKVKIEHAPREEVFFTLATLLREFGEEIKKKSQSLYQKLMDYFEFFSKAYQIYSLREGMRIVYAPSSFEYRNQKYYLQGFKLAFQTNAVFMPTLRSKLELILNPAVVDGAKEFSVELLEDEVISIKSQGNLKPILSLILEGQRLTIKPVVLDTDPEQKEGSASSVESEFMKLELKSQIAILNGLADALISTFNGSDQLNPVLEKNIRFISQAADFLEVSAPVEKRATPSLDGSLKGIFSRFSQRSSGAAGHAVTPNESPSLERASEKKGRTGSLISRLTLLGRGSQGNREQDKTQASASVPNDLPPPPSLSTPTLGGKEEK